MIKITDAEFKYLVDYLKGRYGLNLPQKRVLVEGRLGSYLMQRGFESYTEYIKMLEADKSGHELTNLLNKVTTNHTFFMREPDHFDYFANVVLPFMEKRVQSRDLRIWCAASSSGEEPYTLAMILEDYFGSKSPKWDKVLLASDISEKVLEQARTGVYDAESIAMMPETWKRKYFKKVAGDKVEVVPNIKSQVVFRIFNLMDPIKYKKPFHIIFCRNVMIYFDGPTKTAVTERFYDAMEPGGYLFIGHTESISRPTRFEFVVPSVYRKGG